MSGFGKITLLLTSKAKQIYAGQISHHIHQNLVAKAASIQTRLGAAPKGYILVTDTHTSQSDSKPHYTIDAYDKDQNGLDKPIGCIHMYEDNEIRIYQTPRTKAYDAYVKKLAGSS